MSARMMDLQMMTFCRWSSPLKGNRRGRPLARSPLHKLLHRWLVMNGQHVPEPDAKPTRRSSRPFALVSPAIDTRTTGCFYELFVLGGALHTVGGAGSVVRSDSHLHLEYWLLLCTLCSLHPLGVAGVWYVVMAINTRTTDCFYALFVLGRALHTVGWERSQVRSDSHQHMEHWLFFCTLCSRKANSSSGWSGESGTGWQQSTHGERILFMYSLF
jgi:hypothetical protein